MEYARIGRVTIHILAPEAGSGNWEDVMFIYIHIFVYVYIIHMYICIFYMCACIPYIHIHECVYSSSHACAIPGFTLFFLIFPKLSQQPDVYLKGHYYQLLYVLLCMHSVL